MRKTTKAKKKEKILLKEKLPFSVFEEWKSTDSISRKSFLEQTITDKIHEYFNLVLLANGLKPEDYCFYYPDAQEGEVGTFFSALYDNKHIAIEYQPKDNYLEKLDNFTMNDIFEVKR